MVLGRSTTLRRDESFKAPSEDSSRGLLRSISLAVKGRGSVNGANVQATQTAVRRAGWAALRDHLRFYGKYLVPEIAITVLMFGCFAVMSGLVPYLLCHDDVRDPMVRSWGCGARVHSGACSRGPSGCSCPALHCQPCLVRQARASPAPTR